jgi:small conductance mechanosensitive channel
MWEWFITNGLWILAAAGGGLVLFLLLRRWTPVAIDKLVPEQWQQQLKDIERVVYWAIISIGGVILALAVTAVTISRYGVNITPALQTVGGWLLTHGIRILLILVLARLFYITTRAVLPPITGRWVKVRGRGRHARREHAKRAETISGVLIYATGILTVAVTIFMVLSEVGIDITPLLAGAGVAGIAIGFAAQGLMKDLIAGFTIIFENQYDVGDVIKAADITGIVEGINLRRTLLRDLDGILHVVPNGEIRVTSNYTMDWSRAHLNIGVAYKEDLDRVMAIIRKTWEELAEDTDWGPQLISKTPWLLRVNEFGDSGIIIKVVGETKPMTQWNVMGELRLRIKRVFDEEGIEIPWPHVKLYMGEGPVEKGLTCKACSRVNLPSSKFCAHCGASLAAK